MPFLGHGLCPGLAAIRYGFGMLLGPLAPVAFVGAGLPGQAELFRAPVAVVRRRCIRLHTGCIAVGRCLGAAAAAAAAAGPGSAVAAAHGNAAGLRLGL